MQCIFVSHQHRRLQKLWRWLVCTHTLQSVLVKMNGLQTPLTSGLGTIMSGSYAFEHFSCHENRSTEPHSSSMQLVALCKCYTFTFSSLKRLGACGNAASGYFEHMLKWTTFQDFSIYNSHWQWKLQFTVDYSVHNWNYCTKYYRLLLVLCLPLFIF